MSWFQASVKFAITIVLVLGLAVVGVNAQKKKKRTTRRTSKPAAPKPVINNPTIAPPTTTDANGDVKIISTADQTAEDPKPQSSEAKPKPTPSEEKEMKQTISNLSNQVDRLNDRLSSMQEDDRYQLDMERLTRAEQRSEQVRLQLIDTQSKLADLEAKLEQVEYNLKPENIERVTQGMGTLRPEDARDSRRKQLENEKSRLLAQIKILESSKSRLETSLAMADAEVDTLRAKMEQRRLQMDSAPANEGRPKKP